MSGTTAKAIIIGGGALLVFLAWRYWSAWGRWIGWALALYGAAFMAFRQGWFGLRIPPDMNIINIFFGPLIYFFGSRPAVTA